MQVTETCHEAQEGMMGVMQDLSDEKEENLKQEEERNKELKEQKKIISNQEEEITKLKGEISKSSDGSKRTLRDYYAERKKRIVLQEKNDKTAKAIKGLESSNRKLKKKELLFYPDMKTHVEYKPQEVKDSQQEYMANTLPEYSAEDTSMEPNIGDTTNENFLDSTHVSTSSDSDGTQERMKRKRNSNKRTYKSGSSSESSAGRSDSSKGSHRSYKSGRSARSEKPDDYKFKTPLPPKSVTEVKLEKQIKELKELQKRDNQVIEKLRSDLEKVNMAPKDTMNQDPDYIEVIEIPDDPQEVTYITSNTASNHQVDNNPHTGVSLSSGVTHKEAITSHTGVASHLQQVMIPHTGENHIQCNIDTTSTLLVDNNPHTGVSLPSGSAHTEAKTSHTGVASYLKNPHTGENHIQCNTQQVIKPHTGDNHTQCITHTGDHHIQCQIHTGINHIKCTPHTGESLIQCQTHQQLVDNSHTGVIPQAEAYPKSETITHVNALPQTVDSSHTGVNTQLGTNSHKVAQQKDSHTGTNQEPHTEDNPHTGVNPQLEAKPQRVTTSHTGETTLNNCVNSSHTGVMSPGVNSLSHTGETPLQNQVINPHTGVSSLGVNPHTGATPQAGAIPHTEVAARPDPLSDMEVASLLDGLPSTGSEIEWKYLGNGAWTVPTQYLAWIKVLKDKEGNIPIYQFEVIYRYVGRHPHGIPNYVELAGHPEPSNLNLKYSHNGEWVKVPKEKWDSSGPDYTYFHMGRLERYLDNKGNLKMAVAYGRTKEDLKSWFNYETLREFLGNWVLPTVPYWYNNPMVIMEKVRKEHEASGVKGINNQNENNSQNTQQNKKKEKNKQNNTQVGKKTPDEPVRSNSQNRPPKPQRPRKDSSRDSRNSGRSHEQRRDNSHERSSRYDRGFIRKELDDYYGEEERKYEERNRNRYRQEDRYYHDEDSPRDHPGRGRGEDHRDRTDRSRNPGPNHRENYDRSGHRDSSRESYRGDYREDRRSERSPSRERGRDHGATRAKVYKYGRGRRS